jgi:hypothetical protein
MSSIKHLLVLKSLLLFSCAGNNIYSEFINNISFLISEPKDISIVKVNSIPYDSIQVRLGRGQNTLLVLEEVQDDILKWTSSNFVKIYTKKGMIVRVSGLENELKRKDIDKRHPVLTKRFSKKEVIDLTNFYTFSNPDLHLLPVKTSFRFDKTEKIKILGEEVFTSVYLEETKDNLISWNFINKYWVNLEGNIVRSEESFTPKNQSAYVLVTKKRKPENKSGFLKN